MPVCQVCQHDNPAGAEFCEECGAALTPAAAPESLPAEVDQAPSTGDMPESVTPADSNTEPVPSDLGEPPAAGTPLPAAGEETASQPVDGTAQRARLVAIRFGAPSGDEIPLLGQRLVVGRFDPETGPVDIDLSSTAESGHISRQHAELYQEDGRWIVRDLGSTNGVFVKGSGDTSFGPRISAPRPLSEGDEVAFGNSRFVFRTD
jgi:hypothetical protein